MCSPVSSRLGVRLLGYVKEFDSAREQCHIPLLSLASRNACNKQMGKANDSEYRGRKHAHDHHAFRHYLNMISSSCLSGIVGLHLI